MGMTRATLELLDIGRSSNAGDKFPRRDSAFGDALDCQTVGNSESRDIGFRVDLHVDGGGGRGHSVLDSRYLIQNSSV